MQRVNHRFLFWNNWLFEDCQNLRRNLHRPVKHARPLLADALAWASVIRDPDTGIFRMWYNTRRALPDAARREPFYMFRLAYAESPDGVSWERPALNILPDMSAPNNFTDALMVEGAFVCHDRHDPHPARRYKLLYVPLNAAQSPQLGVGPATDDVQAYVTRGLSLAVSPDGWRWRRAPQPRILPHNSDAHNTMVFDAQNSLYQVYCRPALSDRRIAVCLSRDLADWSPPLIVLEPDEIQTQFYGMVPIPMYGGYAGLISVFRTEAYDPALGHMRGMCHAELAHSSDGIGWQRLAPGTPWLDRGADPGDFDHGMVFPLAAVETPEKILIYYQGIRATHAVVKKDRSECALGLATLRKDGFVSLDADAAAGAVTTRHTASYSLADASRAWRGKIQWTDFRDGTLWINARTAADGLVEAELLDERWRVIPGCARADCIAFRGDAVRAPLRWKEHAGLEPATRIFSIRLFLRRASLFSFWME